MKARYVIIAFMICASYGFGHTTQCRAADTPHVFWVSDPVLPNETVLATGEDMSSVTNVRVTRLDDATPTGSFTTANVPAKAWRDVKPVQITARSIKFVVPADWKAGVYECQMVAGTDVSKTVTINAPDPWWMQSDGRATGTPGGWLRVFGKSLNFGGTSRAELRDASGAKTVITAGSGDGFALKFNLPKSLKLGKYTVYVHNGNGGDSSWVKVGTLNVAQPEAWPSQVFNVMDYYGASKDQEIRKTLGKGSPALDRTDAVQAALSKANAAGGGVVYFPEGAYSIRGAIAVPAHTILRGAGQGRVSLWWGNGQFALDGGSDQRRINDAYSTPPRLITGGAFGLEDMTIIAPRQYDCVIDAGDDFEMQRVKVLVNRFWVRDGTREDGMTVLMGKYGTVTDCDILAKGLGIAFSNGIGDVIARNRVQAGKCPISLQTADGMIVEDNQFISLDPTAYINLSNVGRNLYYAHNRHEAEFGVQSDFSWTFDGSGVAYQGAVATADGTQLTLAKDPSYPSWEPESSPIWKRGVVCVLAGKGTGQLRFVTANAGRSWQVDRPFDVSPDTSSVVCIVPFRGRTLMIGNHFEDSGWVNLGYGTSIDVVCANNSMYRCGALLNYGLRDPDGVLPSWHVQYFDNDVYEGATLVQTTADHRNADVFSGTSTTAAVHRRLHMHADNGGSIDVGANATDVIVEHCQLDNARSVLSVSADSSGVLLRGNHFAGTSSYIGNGVSKATIIR